MLTVVEDTAASDDAGHAARAEELDGDKASAAPAATRHVAITMLLREFIFCAALALTTYGALQTSPPKISRHPPPARFFPADSPVLDWYQGQLGSALAATARADVSLLMYYAPWDAECRHVRSEFDKAARIIGDQVHFAAINCWAAGSECRLQHSKMPSWPVIMAYTVNSKGVLYRGPRDAHSLVKFAELVSRPLHRVSNLSDLIELVAVCDAVLVGFTPLISTYKHYNTWYSSALRWREHDPLGAVCVAVVTSERLAAQLGGARPVLARYILWGGTADYTGSGDDPSQDYAADDEDWTESKLVEWALRKLSRPAAKVNPAWHKSNNLQTHIGDGPVLILFTPLEPLYLHQPTYDLLREVGAEYLDCAGSEWTHEISRLVQLQRRNAPGEAAQCAHREAPAALRFRKVLSQYKAVWHNTTHTKKKKNGLYRMLLRNDIVRAVSGGKSDTLFISAAEELTSNAEAEESYNDLQQCEAPHQPLPLEIPVTSMVTDADALSADALRRAHGARACRLARKAAARTPLVLPRVQPYTHVRGLACKSNSTLKLIAIDSIRNHHFAESLGVDILNRPDKTAVVILDSKTESQFEMREPYGEASIRDFIRNYTAHTLKRALRSAVLEPEYTHSYRAGSDASDGSEADSLIVEELTTKTFGRFVKKSGESGVVLVCGGACPSHVTRSVLGAARVLARHATRTRVARVDALRHDLPWQYTTSVHPAIIVFPPDRRQESRTYPVTERVSVSGAAALLARALGASVELRLQLAACVAAQSLEGKRQCLSGMRAHVTSLTARALRSWRRGNTGDAALGALARLNAVAWRLHELHVSHLNPGDHRQEKLLESLDQLAQTRHARSSLADIQPHSS